MVFTVGWPRYSVFLRSAFLMVSHMDSMPLARASNEIRVSKMALKDFRYFRRNISETAAIRLRLTISR